MYLTCVLLQVEELEWTGLEGELYKVDTKLMDPRTKGHNPERLSLLKVQCRRTTSCNACLEAVLGC